MKSMPDISQDSICAVVVTFNRKNLLLQCLDALTKQTRPLQSILIIDNCSTDGTPKTLFDAGHIGCLPPDVLDSPWVHDVDQEKNSPSGETISISYVRMNINSGGAGGFHEGMKRGHQAGHNWLWLMDDDGFPDCDCLASLLKDSQLHELQVLNPLVINKDDRSLLSFQVRRQNTTVSESQALADPDGMIRNMAAAFNGTLLSSDAIETNGYVKKEMFIWGDENEYLLRLKSNQIEYATSTKARFYHPEGKTVYSKALFGLVEATVKPEHLEVNFFRNMGYIDKKYHSKIAVKVILNYLIYFSATLQPMRALRFLRYYFDGWFDTYKLPSLLPKK